MNAIITATVRMANVGKFYMIDFKRGKRAKSYAWIQTNYELEIVGIVPPTDSDILSIAKDPEMARVTGRAEVIEIVRDGRSNLIAIKAGGK